MTAPLLTVENLAVTYPGRGRRPPKTAVEGISFTLGAGETLGLVGESGSGKTTVANVVLGLVSATSGRVLLDGEDITALRPAQRRTLSRRIQAVFQDPYSTFNPQRTIGQTVAETIATERAPRDEVRTRVRRMLERVGIDGAAVDSYPSQFSGGQRQRIAIARALLPEPELIVCDESVSALDLSVQAQILNLLADLQRERGTAYLFITHDLTVLRHVARDVVVMRQGTVVEAGTADSVLSSPKTTYTRDLIAAAPLMDPDAQAEKRRQRLVSRDTARCMQGAEPTAAPALN